MFPFDVSLLVPTIRGHPPCPPTQEMVPLLLANALQVVAGTPHPPTRPPVKSPEFLTRVVVVDGLKKVTFPLVNPLVRFLASIALGLVMARLILTRWVKLRTLLAFPIGTKRVILATLLPLGTMHILPIDGSRVSP